MTQENTSRLEQPLAIDAPPLPGSPFQFCVYFLKYCKWLLSLMVVFEAGQVACAMMLPYAIKQIMDAVELAQKSGFPVWGLHR